jgi:hypothetical protein
VTLNIATTGLDSNTYTQAQNSGTPWLTVAHAIATMANGDTVLIAAGTYNEDLVISTGGASGAYRTLEAADQANPPRINSLQLQTSSAAFWRFRFITFGGNGAGNGQGYAVKATYSSTGTNAAHDLLFWRCIMEYANPVAGVGTTSNHGQGYLQTGTCYNVQQWYCIYRNNGHCLVTITQGGTWTGGTFTISVDGTATAAINWNDTAATVQTRLEAVVGVGNVLANGGPLPGTSVSFWLKKPAYVVTTSSLTGTTPTISLAFNTLDHGIYINSGRDTWLIGGLSYDNTSYGVQIYMGSGDTNEVRRIYVANFTSNGNKFRGGFVIQGDTTNTTVNASPWQVGDVHVYNSIATNHLLSATAGYTSQYSGTPDVHITIENCLGFNNVGGQTGGNYLSTDILQNGSAGSITNSDPVYVDAPNKNFRLQSSSPAKNVGLAAFTPLLDLDGNTRVTADLGAYKAA